MEAMNMAATTHTKCRVQLKLGRHSRVFSGDADQHLGYIWQSRCRHCTSPTQQETRQHWPCLAIARTGTKPGNGPEFFAFMSAEQRLQVNFKTRSTTWGGAAHTQLARVDVPLAGDEPRQVGLYRKPVAAAVDLVLNDAPCRCANVACQCPPRLNRPPFTR
jgi:hypothetical protein